MARVIEVVLVALAIVAAAAAGHAVAALLFLA
jgi:hypothetical protein